MQITLPQLSLVLLAGPSGSGKTTFGATHFGPHEVVSSDACRALVSGDETALDATDDAFDLLYHLVGLRLKRGLLTVVDATNVRAEDRRGLVELAREHHVLPTIVVLLPPLEVCLARTAARADRDFGPGVVRKQYTALRRSLRGLKREGFRRSYVLESEADIAAVAGIERERLYNDLRHETGPFDVIGDVHGCLAELETLLVQLGYVAPAYTHPEGRRLVFVGDLVDRGPDAVGVLRLVMRLVAAGTAYCVVGNHDARLQRHLAGKKVQLTHGLLDTATALAAESDAFRRDVRDFLYGLISHYVFDGGRLVVAHAGLPEEMHGRGSRAVRQFAMYGETTGEIDEFGLPVRYPWARDYRGDARVVYGHTPVPAPEWLNNTLDIDTGCCFGGSLTALRYPELETASVPALQTYVEPVRPVETRSPGSTGSVDDAPLADGLLDVADFLGKRRVQTAWAGRVTLPAEKAAGALEVMSRFAIDPRWLVYLPPTMSPCGTSELPDYLEHPRQAFSYYRRRGVRRVICEEKHMGSRAVVVLCRRPEVATERFGVPEAGWGAVYTRTGRAFFPDAETEQALLARLATAAQAAGLWMELSTDWLVLDCEVLPWSAKAQSLIETQYAGVGASAKTSLAAVADALSGGHARQLPGAAELLAGVTAKQEAIERYRAAYRPYCWPVHTLEDYAVAPFHVLASEGAVHVERDHDWHLGLIDRLCAADEGVLQSTNRLHVDPQDEASVATGTNWWLEMTAAGGEGMVVKPLGFSVRHDGKLVQPGVKCRGRDYLRLIYGPTYTLALDRLRDRKLQRKRGLAVREFGLGVEALQRFVDGEPLRRVHECVFGVLALEGEGVDARL